MPVPVGYYDVTAIWKPATSARVATVGFGLVDFSVSTPRPAADVADDVYSTFTTSGHPGAANGMIDDWSFLGISVALGTSTGDDVGQHLATIAGTVTDSCVPSNCALLIKKNTASGGRRYRGRFFVPPCMINEGAVDQSGFLASGTVTAMQTMWDAVMSGLEADEYTMVLFHQGAGAPGPTPVTSLSVQSQLATQRRRMRS